MYVHYTRTYVSLQDDHLKDATQSNHNKHIEDKCKHDLSSHQSKGDILLNAILRSCSRDLSEDDGAAQVESKNACVSVEKMEASCDSNCVQRCACAPECESDNNIISCDKRSASGDIFSIKDNAKFKIYVDDKANYCDSPTPIMKHKKLKDISNCQSARKKITFEDDKLSNVEKSGATFPADEFLNCKDALFCGLDIPSALDQARFKKSLDNATSMVFHSRTGLPLTSSPAPIRRGNSCFDFDSSINSVSAIGRYVSPTQLIPPF